jgi:RecB family endonuclease NucS
MMQDSPPSPRVNIKQRLVHYEKELKALMRAQLDKIETGLVAIDGGKERAVETGRIDITARDVMGRYVVIELKAGPCPTGAIEQVMGYTQDLEQETGQPCRAVIVASEFSPRQRSAVKRVRDIHLVTCSLGTMAFAKELPQPHKTPIDRAARQLERL